MYMKARDPVQRAEASEKRKARHTQPVRVVKVRRPRREHIPSQTRYAVWRRDASQCTYEMNGKRCPCRRGLQIDHIQPVALGGTNELDNLRLVCRGHHRMYTERTFGKYRGRTYAQN